VVPIVPEAVTWALAYFVSFVGGPSSKRGDIRIEPLRQIG
jgi:hypothetical protein